MAEVEKLSPYQEKIAHLVALGFSNREIGEELGTTEQAVKSALHVIFNKTGCWNRVELSNRLLQGLPFEVREQSRQRIEAARLQALHERKVLDSTAESTFDEITNAMVSVFDVPIALVALMDSDRLWFKSNIGLNVSEVPRELTICNRTIQQSQALVVENASEDPRFGGTPLVEKFGVRFYAAAPIITGDGYPLGVVCIVDHVPREFTQQQLSVLTSFARLALHQLELRRELLDAKEPSSQPLQATEVRVQNGDFMAKKPAA